MRASVTVLLSLFLVLAPLTGSTGNKKPSPAQLELIILEAPGPVGCYTDHRPIFITDCQEREAAVAAFRALLSIDERRAHTAVLKRFGEIPSARGGYLPIMLAVLSKDRRYIPVLEAVGKKVPRTELAALANQAANLLRDGKCGDPDNPRFAELCNLR